MTDSQQTPQSTPAVPSVPSARTSARLRALAVLSGLVLASCLSLIFAGAVGSVSLGYGELVQALPAWLISLWQEPSLAGTGAEIPLAQTLLDLRLSRGLSAWVTGASLALAGVLMQALLRNPLADPYVLGVSGGAAVGALLALLLGCALWVVDAAAFAGACLISILLVGLAWRDWRSQMSFQSAPLLLLTGVILSSGCSAIVSLILSIAPENRLRGMVFWLIGDLGGAQLRWLPWLVFAGAIAFCVRQARAINMLAMFADMASTLGVAIGRLRLGLFLCAALLTASAVTSGGSIGFLGLIVPHACRFALGPDHRLLLPASALAGGCFLVIADTLARTLFAPQQLPVGVLTALIGVPAFLLQLHHVRRIRSA